MAGNKRSSLFGRRRFVALAGAASAAATLAGADTPRPITQASVPGDPVAPKEQQGTVSASLPFDEPLVYHSRPIEMSVEPFPMAAVRLLPSPFRDAQEANRGQLHRWQPDRLLHTFRITAGLPTTAQPLGGWEKPDGELRGHFPGHYLSACALMYASTGDSELKERGDYMVAELAKCQQRMGTGYLSAYPTELFDRLKARKRVWAPFYTYHKILAGMIDMHQHAGNRQALEVAKGMADWVDAWTAALSFEQMQMVLDEEFGGMNEALYNLAALTSSDKYAAAGDRFTKHRFFDPLALHRDQLRGLHTNTHIPQVTGAARRYELSSDMRFHDVADTFWHAVVDTRTYANGGTSNNEGWLTEPNHLAQELRQSPSTNECCCAYNMLKLARKLYAWSGDPRYFDYYERVLFNHRLGTIDLKDGHTQYFLGVVPGSWRTFGTEENSFWCCTGTGAEEFSKLTDSIYYRRGDAIYVNLFIPSELNWKERGVRVMQTNRFPADPSTRLEVQVDSPKQFGLHVRVPSWVAGYPKVSINGQAAELSAGPGSYVVIARTWRRGDRVDITFPMSVSVESMPDDPSLQAFLYGPVLLAGRLGQGTIPADLIVGPMGPDFKKHTPPEAPPLHAASARPQDWIRRTSSLAFQAGSGNDAVQMIPFNEIGPGQPYTVYWKVT